MAAALAATIIVGVPVLTLDYVEGEGFNPSDDGVVLAQAYRILHGEVPHRDFISLRPALSGVIHLVHFVSPLPLVVSGRVFFLAEVLALSIAWTALLWRTFRWKRYGPRIALALCLACNLAGFALNLGTAFMFPWTTTDALFLSAVGALALMLALLAPQSAHRRPILCLAALFCMALAALCRQAFGIPFAIATAWCLLIVLRGRGWVLRGAVGAAGALPLLAYVGILASSGALPAFLSQMAGRREFVGTGVLTPAWSLVRPRFIAIHILMIAWVGFVGVARGTGPWNRLDGVRRLVRRTEPALWPVYASCAAAYLLAVAAAVLGCGYGGNVFSYEFLWTLFLASAAAAAAGRLPVRQFGAVVLALALGWTCSLSGGLNSPALASGILTTTTAAILLHLLRSRARRTIRNPALLACAATVLASGLFGYALVAQRWNNYRDLPSNQLAYRLGDLFEGFGGIRTNERTYAFFKDLRHLAGKYAHMKGRIVVLPDGAIAYPLLQTRNPFPLDWPQRAEFAGQEEEVLRRMRMAIQSEPTLLLVEKVDVKTLARGIIDKPLDRSYYPYIDAVLERCVRVEETAFFTVYMSVVQPHAGHETTTRGCQGPAAQDSPGVARGESH